MNVNDRRAELAGQIREPSPDRDDIERWLADCQAQSRRLDEDHLLSGVGRSAAIYMTHEATLDWFTATADRWYRALPERYMTPDSLRRPDWDHSHYPHDEHGHIGRVTTRSRPETEADTRAERLAAGILADLESESNDHA